MIHRKNTEERFASAPETHVDFPVFLQRKNIATDDNKREEESKTNDQGPREKKTRLESKSGAHYKQRERNVIEPPNSGLQCTSFTVNEQVTVYYDGGLNNLYYHGVVKAVREKDNMVDVFLNELVKTVPMLPTLLFKGWERFAQ